MDQDIELGNIGEGTPLLPGYSGGRSRVHAGYGASRLPLRPSAGTAFAAGQTHQKIFEGHLGTAAGDPNNWLSQQFYKLLYKKNEEVGVSKDDTDHKETLTGVQAVKKGHVHKEPTRGWVLPFSNNIGPGNEIQGALNEADKVAQGHDLHYKYAKTDEDITEADKEAIQHFIAVALKSQNPIEQFHAVIGAGGLTAKRILEYIRGHPVYGEYGQTTGASPVRTGELVLYEQWPEAICYGAVASRTGP